MNLSRSGGVSNLYGMLKIGNFQSRKRNDDKIISTVNDNQMYDN